MNSLIEQYRKAYPGDTATDDALLDAFGKVQDESGQFSQFPDFLNQWNERKQQLRDAQYVGVWDEAKKGFARQARGTAATALGGLGMLSDFVTPDDGGPEPVRDWFLRKAQEQDQAASVPELTPNVPTYKDVTLSNAPAYVASKLGEAAPSVIEGMVTSAAGAAVGGTVGTSVGPEGTVIGAAGGAIAGLVEKQAIKNLISRAVKNKISAGAKEIVERELAGGIKGALSDKAKSMLALEAKAVAMRYGAAIGATLNSYVLNAGEIYNELASDPNIGPDKALDVAMLGGLVSAVPDSFVPSYVAGKLLTGIADEAKDAVKRPFFHYLASTGKELAKTIPAEAVTEGFQEWVNVAAKSYAEGKPIPTWGDLDDATKDRIFEAGIGGAAGGLLSGPIASLGDIRKKIKTDEQKQGDEQQQKESVDLINEARVNLENYVPEVDPARAKEVVDLAKKSADNTLSTVDKLAIKAMPPGDQNAVTLVADKLKEEAAKVKPAEPETKPAEPPQPEPNDFEEFKADLKATVSEIAERLRAESKAKEIPETLKNKFGANLTYASILNPNVKPLREGALNGIDLVSQLWISVQNGNEKAKLLMGPDDRSLYLDPKDVIEMSSDYPSKLKAAIEEDSRLAKAKVGSEVKPNAEVQIQGQKEIAQPQPKPAAVTETAPVAAAVPKPVDERRAAAAMAIGEETKPAKPKESPPPQAIRGATTPSEAKTEVALPAPVKEPGTATPALSPAEETPPPKPAEATLPASAVSAPTPTVTPEPTKLALASAEQAKVQELSSPIKIKLDDIKSTVQSGKLLTEKQINSWNAMGQTLREAPKNDKLKIAAEAIRKHLTEPEQATIEQYVTNQFNAGKVGKEKAAKAATKPPTPTPAPVPAPAPVAATPPAPQVAPVPAPKEATPAKQAPAASQYKTVSEVETKPLYEGSPADQKAQRDIAVQSAMAESSTNARANHVTPPETHKMRGANFKASVTVTAPSGKSEYISTNSAVEAVEAAVKEVEKQNTINAELKAAGKPENSPRAVPVVFTSDSGTWVQTYHPDGRVDYSIAPGSVLSAKLGASASELLADVESHMKNSPSVADFSKAGQRGQKGKDGGFPFVYNDLDVAKKDPDAMNNLIKAAGTTVSKVKSETNKVIVWKRVGKEGLEFMASAVANDNKRSAAGTKTVPLHANPNGNRLMTGELFDAGWSPLVILTTKNIVSSNDYAFALSESEVGNIIDTLAGAIESNKSYEEPISIESDNVVEDSENPDDILRDAIDTLIDEINATTLEEFHDNLVDIAKYGTTDQIKAIESLVRLSNTDENKDKEQHIGEAFIGALQDKTDKSPSEYVFKKLRQTEGVSSASTNPDRSRTEASPAGGTEQVTGTPEVKLTTPSPVSVGEQEVSDTDAWLRDIQDAARAAGISVRNVSMDELVAELGIDPKEVEGLESAGAAKGNVIRQVLNAILGSQDIRTALHEIGHVVFGRMTDAEQAMVTRAIDGLTVPDSNDVRIAQNKAGSEENLVERVAINLQREGFNPAQANGMAQRFVRAVKELIYKAALWVIDRTGFVSKSTANDLALAYFRNRVERILTGNNSTYRATNMVGGPSMNDWQQASMFSRLAYIERDGGVVAVGNQPTNVGMVKWTRIPKVNQGIARDMSVAQKHVDISALNAESDLLRKLYTQWRMTTGSGLSYDDFLEIALPGNYSDPKKVIEAIGNQFNALGFDPKEVAMAQATTVATMNEAARPEAANAAVKILNGLRLKWANRNIEYRDDIGTMMAPGPAMKELSRLLARFSKLSGETLKAERIWADAKTDLLEWAKSLNDAVLEQRDAAYDTGALHEVIREIEDSMSPEIGTQWITAVNRMMKQLDSSIPSQRQFFKLLEFIGKQDIDWKSMKAKDARAEIKRIAPPEFASYVNDKAYIATAIAFARRNQNVMDRLAIRGHVKMAELSVIESVFRAAEKDTEQAMRMVAGMGISKVPRAYAALQRILVEKENADKKLKAIQKRMNDEAEFMRWYEASLPLMDEEFAKYERIIGAEYLRPFEGNDGDKFLEVENPTDTPQQIIDRFNNPKRDNIFKNERKPADVEKLLEVIRKNRAWLDAHGPGDALYGGAMWEKIFNQNEAMSMSLGDGEHSNIRESWISRTFVSLTQMARHVGTASAKQVERMLNHYETIRHVNREALDRLSTDFSSSAMKAMKALGMRSHQYESLFKPLFYDLPFQFINRNKEELYKDGVSANEAVRNVLAKLKVAMEANPVTAKFLTNPQAWPALVKHWQAAVDASQYWVKLGEKGGLKIQDNDGLYRNVKGAPWFEMMQRVNDVAKSLHEAMRNDGWLKHDMTAEKFIAAYNTDKDALKKTLAPLFTERVWRDMVEALAKMYGKNPFKSSDGSAASRAMAVAALKSVKVGDFIGFTDALYKMTTPEKDMTEAKFAAQTFGTIQGFFGVLNKLHNEQEEARGLGFESVSHLLMDARRAETFPPEWLDIRGYSNKDNRHILNHLSYHIAFGRNMAKLFRALDLADKEADVIVRKGEEIKKDVDKANPGVEVKKLKQKYADEARKKGMDWPAIEKAFRDKAEMLYIRHQIESLIREHNDSAVELSWWNQAVTSIASMVVQGAKTAITDTSSIYKPVQNLGLSHQSISMVKSAFKELVKQNVMSVGSLFWDLSAWNSDRMNRMLRLGYTDSGAMRSMREALKDSMDKLDAINMEVPEGQKFGRLTKAGRIAREAINTSLPSKTPGAQGLRILAPFTQIQRTMLLAVMDAVAKQYEDLTARAVEYYIKNPTQIGKPIEADSIGYGKSWGGLVNDKMAFEKLKADLERVNLSLEFMAEDYIARKAKDPKTPLLTDSQLQAVSILASMDILQDNTLGSRQPRLITGTGMLSKLPLLGWAIQQSASVALSFRGEKGQSSSWKDRMMLKDPYFNKGMVSMLAMVPFGLAYAFMRDLWDERMVGKKANVMPAGTIRGTIDRLATVGQWGIAGDMVNSLVNMDIYRPFSLDSRVLWFSSMVNSAKAAASIPFQQGASYETTWRPLLQSLGGSGFMQNADVLLSAVKMTGEGATNPEALVLKRINAQNWLRAVGRELNMDVRKGGVSSASLPTKTRLRVRQMATAALADDPTAFREAYRAAIEAAKEDHDDPERYVKQAFSSQHPLRVVFQTTPTDGDLRRMLGEMSDDGREAVVEALRLHNRYLERIGANVPEGKLKAKPNRNRTDFLGSAIERFY